MTDIIWPISFPSTTIYNYQLTKDVAIARVTMEGGNSKQRQRFTSASKFLKANWVMEQSTFSLFETWFKFKAKLGAKWITMRLVTEDPLGDVKVRFISSYNATPLSHNYWNVSAELEVRESNTTSEAELDRALLDLAIDTGDLYKFENTLHGFVHVEKSTTYKW